MTIINGTLVDDVGLGSGLSLSGSTLSGGLSGNPQIISSNLSIAAGTWYQNTSGTDMMLCVPLTLASDSTANLYVGATSGATSTAALGNFQNGNSAYMVASAYGIVPADWWYIVSTSGSVTIGGASYPATAYSR